MMDIVCKGCGKAYRIDEAKLTSSKVRIRCKNCNESITITKPGKLIRADQPTHAPREKEPSSPAPEGRLSAPVIEKVSWFNSIQVRVSMVLFLLTTVILASFGIYNYFQTRERLGKEFRLLADIAASRLSIHLTESLWDLDDKQVGDSLAAEMLDQQIQGIIVRDNDGKTIFSGKIRNAAGKVTDTKDNPQGNLVTGSKPIRRGGELIGMVEVYLTPRFLEANFKQSLQTITITAATLIFFMFLVMYISMRTMIIGPIMELTDVAEKMSMGVLNARITIRSKNEIGLLAGAIERMQTSLRLAIERLRSR